MPFDPTVAIVFGTLLSAFVASLLYAVWYQNLKHRRGGASSSESVTVSELNAMIQEAVGEAVTPIERRLERLEEEHAGLPEHEPIHALPGRERPRS